MSWTARPDGALSGELTATNVSDRRVRLSGKPALVPLGGDGMPLDAMTVVTTEFIVPGYVTVDPGESASAEVGWGAWNGPDPSGDLVVRWPGGEATIRPVGPRRPSATGPATNLWSTWFRLR
jgi:hypothetical protein